MLNLCRVLFSGVAALAVLGGTCSAATLTYRFAFTDVGPLGDVSGVVSFTAPVAPVSTLPALTDVTFKFDQPQPLLSPAVVNGAVGLFDENDNWYAAIFGPVTVFPQDPGEYIVALFLYPNNNDPYSAIKPVFVYIPLEGEPGPQVKGQVTRVVPEPATLWLLGMTLAGVAVRRRRR